MSSVTPNQDGFSPYVPRTLAGRRFVEFCKQDQLSQQQTPLFDRDLYDETVRYVLAQLDTISLLEQETGL